MNKKVIFSFLILLTFVFTARYAFAQTLEERPSVVPTHDNSMFPIVRNIFPSAPSTQRPTPFIEQINPLSPIVLEEESVVSVGEDVVADENINIGERDNDKQNIDNSTEDDRSFDTAPSDNTDTSGLFDNLIDKIGDYVDGVVEKVRDIFRDEEVVQEDPKADEVTAKEVDESLFSVVDEVTDRAILPDGNTMDRVYLHPREIYTDEIGTVRERPQGWHKFDEDVRSQLKNNKDVGYSFVLPFSGNNEYVEVFSGAVERAGNDKVISSQQSRQATFLQDRSASSEQIVSTYENVYPDVDINFVDRRQARTKEIVIKTKPEIKSDERLIFWEKYKVPANAKIFVGDKEYSAQIKTTAPVQVKMDGEGALLITPSIIFDSAILKDDPRYPVHVDMTQQAVEQIVQFDRDSLELRIGLIVDGEYLLDAHKVYPIIIDPTYITCDTNTCEGDIYLSWLTGKSAWNYPYLIMGYDYGDASGVCAGTTISRHTVLKFDFQGNSIPNGQTISSAKVTLRRNTGVVGCGNYTGDISFSPKKITKSWALADDITYSYVRGTLATGGQALNLKQSGSCTNCEFVLDNAMVTGWLNSPSTNYGLLIEPTENFPSGTTVPTSWSSKQRLFWFYSSNNSNSTYDPYLTIVYATIAKPDLTIYSKSLSKTSVSPGETITAYTKIKNSGTGTAGGSYVGYYYSTNNICTTSDTKLAGDLVQSLSSGQISSEESASIVIPTNVIVGQTGYICFIADYLGGISELSESNNTAYQAVAIVSAPKPNLTKYTDSVSPTTVKPGQTINLNLTVKNIGTASAGSSYVYYYFKKDSTSYTSAYNFGTDSVSSLAVNGTSVESVSYTVPVGTVPGTYYLYYWIDAEGIVPESNEYDNKFQTTVTVQAADVHDVDITSVSFANSGGYYQDGNTVSVNVGLQNKGNVSETVPYTFSIVDQSGSAVVFLTNLTANQTISAGQSKTVTLSGMIPYDITMSNNYHQYKAKIQLNVSGDPDLSSDVLNSSNTIYARRYSYGGGGGGGGSLPNSDLDSIPDVAEVYVGTNEFVVDSKQVYDTAYFSYSGSKTDIQSLSYGADPVNLRTGAFEFTQTDFSLPGRGLALNFSRTYISTLSERSSRFGNGWSFSYNSYYYMDETTKNIQLYYGGALVALFTTPDGGVNYEAPKGIFDTLKKVGNTFVYKTLDGVEHIYSKVLTNNLGILEQIKDTNGNITTLGYTDVRGVPLLTSVTDPSGRGIQITYYPDTDEVLWDNIKDVRDTISATNPRITTYTYDTNDNLLTATDNRYYNGTTENIVETYTYDGNGRMMTYTDPRGTILRNVYDSAGRVITQYEYNPNKDSSGTDRKVYELSYEGAYAGSTGSTACTLVKNYRDANIHYDVRTCFNVDQLKIFEQDGMGNSQKWQYDSSGFPSSYTDESGNITQYVYDSSNKTKTSETLPDVNGWHTTRIFSYEPNFNRLTSATETATKSGATTLTRTTYYTIDPANGNVTAINYPLGLLESFVYDNYGNVQTHTDKNGVVTTYTYDSGHNYKQTESVNVTTADGTASTLTSHYTYDGYGNMTSYTTPRNYTYSYVYDTRGNLRKETNPLTKFKTYTYDLENHRISQIDENNHTTEYTYDKDINASLLTVKQKGVSGHSDIVASYTYDWVGNRIGMTDPQGYSTTYTYNAGNRQVTETGPVDTITLIYDNVGNVTSETHTNGAKTAYLYDVRNQKVEERNYTDASHYVYQTLIYDGLGRIISTQDRNNNVTSFEYNILDRLTKKTEPMSGAITTYTYDNNGNKLSELHPRAYSDASLRNSSGHSVTYQYDELNRLKKNIFADNTYTTYFYDGENNLTKTIDHQNSDGSLATHVTEYQYNELGSKKRVTDAYGAHSDYTYDDVGNLKTSSDGMGRVSTFNYDEFNRVTSEIDPANNTTSYQYDANGNKTMITYPDTTATHYTYYEDNQLKTVTDQLNNTRGFTYDSVGNKLTEKDKRNQTTYFNYDFMGRL
ncbi:MAG: hypothetical protein COX81_00030, partial [Candidatus Magasanikbacteria bacterium CG_4_10_14_0_2_um_filter_37_12]